MALQMLLVTDASVLLHLSHDAVLLLILPQVGK